VSSVDAGSPKRGNLEFKSKPMTRLVTKAENIATPPRRGRGLRCKWRPWAGAETSPFDVAQLRTDRVNTKERNSEMAKSSR